MPRYVFLWIVFLGLAVYMTLACGSHVLQSITISPTSADAKDYPNGRVQFVATGHFNTNPLEVTPLSPNWSALDQSLSPTSAVSVTSTGLAQCADGALGTYLIEASDPMPGSHTGMCPELGCVIFATAQLTCP
jgi:hypothetical protein